jgi:formamidopyrimidine-DNA glycosylase
MAERMEGRTIERIDRRAKYLLARLDDGTSWLIHLGMSGRFTLYEAGDGPAEVGKHDHFAIWLDDGGQAVYTDHRRFGVMDLVPTASADEHRLLRNLGIEPLGEELDGRALCKLLRGRRTPMKAALLDQRLVAGLGNIYVCEILNRAGVSPRRRAATVAGVGPGSTLRGERIVAATKQVLEEAISAGGSSISDFVNTDGDLGYFSHSFRVYGREGEPCLRQGCDGQVTRIVQSGRSTFFCPRCQR